MSGIPKGSSRVLGKFGAGPFSWYQSSRFNFLWTLHIMCILKLWGSKWVPSRNGTFAALSLHGREDWVSINLPIGILHCLNRTSNSPTLDQGIQGLRGGISIIEITSVEEIMTALILFQKEARVWWEYCGQNQGEDPIGLSNPTYGDGEYLGVSSLVSTSE
ncbi:hypothetical protein L3X38_001743 [Prunus dulcis]|uniref:Uncharacterized protein n=1 Tax=Prunus dulcis TaxID=3755 RepID=A0AAD4WUZ8_PRUDU|nr:hypothetical protein L3X38_001743 [Prunus dulcis]